MAREKSRAIQDGVTGLRVHHVDCRVAQIVPLFERGGICVSNPLDARHSIINVHVARAANGGWDVTATFENYVLARQHCDDWHRAERASRWMKADAELDRYDELSRETVEALFVA
jgi:hypothetical protein